MLRWMTGGHDAVVVAHADEGAIQLVFGRNFPQFAQQAVLTARGRKLQGIFEANLAGHGGIDHLIKSCKAADLEHFVDFLRGGADVAPYKTVGPC